MKNSISLFLLFFVCLSINLFSQTQPAVTIFWAIDTNDSTVGFGLKKDDSNLHEFGDRIRDTLGIEVRKIPLVGNDYTKEKVNQKLKSLKVDTADALIIVFSDHCVCTEDSIDCRHVKMDDDETIIYRKEVLQLAKKKNARFTMVIQDCCSMPLEIGEDGGKGGDLLSKAKYEKLLLKSRGFLEVYASKYEEYAFVDEEGSFMISCLLDAFYFVIADRESSVQETNWKKIFEEAKVCVQEKAEDVYQDQTLNWNGKVTYDN